KRQRHFLLLHSLKDFIVDDNSSDEDFTKTKPSLRGKFTAAQPSVRRPLSQLNSPVFVSDSEDEDDNIIIRSSWKLRHSKPIPKVQNHDGEDGEEQNVPPSSSEEEFVSLLERLKKKNIMAGASCSPKTSKGEPCFYSSFYKQDKTPAKNPFLKPTGSQTEPRQTFFVSRPVCRGLCKTPGCFLEFLSDPGSCYSSSFKKNKEQLTSKLYQLYNSSVFDNKLPVDMSVTWNKKMRKTAGYCVTGQEKGGGSRYARIELSEKVCDSADRLRDTLIHELCHAATWLINGVRDGHGAFWKLYARKATVLHPELPMVTRCHSYDITYKFRYQCTRCQNTIGRHSKSLDTQKFVCALCTGRLVLMTPSKPRAPTPFANFVKENYGSVRQELAGQSHAEVMRKLSTDFASKTKLSDS
uniref:Germ cell nuclear acidic peptidase n=1 Tax=Oryzias sinensis TaxID=183150 RepID=A0A8C7WNE2_9TELE